MADGQSIEETNGIKALQEQLKALNFKVDVTGEIDRKTQIAFRAFMWDLQAVAAKNGQRSAAVDGVYDAATADAVSSGLQTGFQIPSREEDTRFHGRAERAGKTDAEYAQSLYQAASTMGLANLDAAKLQELRVVDQDGGAPQPVRQLQKSPPGESSGLPADKYISIRTILGALQRQEIKDDRNKDLSPDTRKHWYLPGDSEAARFKAVPLTDPFNAHADGKIKLNYFEIKDELTRLNKQYHLQATPREIEDATKSIMATYGAKAPAGFGAGPMVLLPGGPKRPG